MQAANIEVSQAAIDNGVRGRSERCPLALAYRTHYGRRGLPVSVRSNELRAYWGRYRHSYALPEDAREFIRAFDAGEPVKPFTLALPESTLWDTEGPGYREGRDE